MRPGQVEPADRIAMPRDAVPDCDFSVAASFEDVSSLLRRLRARLGVDHPAVAADDGWELALAEACNNIVEHALADQADASFRLALWIRGDRMVVRLTDRGIPMPPAGDTCAATGPCAADPLPEGGFGRLMIRRLCTSVRYRRVNGENRLDLAIPIPDPARK